MTKLGILGAGQLAQMLAHAAEPLGIQTHCLAKTENDPAAQVATLHCIDPSDEKQLITFAKQVDVLTFENENVESSLVEFLAQYTEVRPTIKAIQTAQDRLLEKKFLAELDIPVAPFFDITTNADLHQAIAAIPPPCLLKTRRFGYDGKGQVRIQTLADLQTAWQSLQAQPLLLEALIPFDTEVSLISVRNTAGEIRSYPLTENVHKSGILRQSNAPFINHALQTLAEQYAYRLLNTLDYVGVLAIEFFVVGTQLIANEIAPRVHNSGHWTQDGAVTCQFENHVRAVCQLPMGSTKAIAPTVMLNCLGHMPELKDVLHFPNVHYHTYHKTPRANRKLGHINLVNADQAQLQQHLQLLEKLV